MKKPKSDRIPTSTINRLLKCRAVDLDAHLQKLMKRYTVHAIDTMRRDLEGEAQKMIAIAEYASVRAGCTGCGVHSHKDAARSANRQQVKVRRALGYAVAQRPNFPIP